MNFNKEAAAFLITALLIISRPLPAQQWCQNHQELTSPSYKQILKKIDDRRSALSNHPLIKGPADQILVKLINAESPIILRWIKKRNLSDKNFKQMSILWRKYYLENFVINKYPLNNQELNAIIENFLQEVNALTFSVDIKKKYQDLFGQAKTYAIKKVGQMPLSAKDKKAIVERIEKIKLYWFRSLKGSKFEKMPLEFIKWGIAYDPIPNEINIGIKALKYSNDETIFAVFAHEIGHSFDPCRWVAFFDGKFPLLKVTSCLRTKDSVNAKRRDDTPLQELVSRGRLTAELALSLKLNPTCNKVNYPPTGFQKDQIQEAFADWFSTEVISIAPYLSINLRNDLCENTQLMPGSSYVTNDTRLSKIYFAHPQVKKRLKVVGSVTYCSY
ncbi:MAG: hypothetical protein ISR65_08440 [Bacteriovoracaceae bacterium]|nr:hypothetical protein [Bacteriovoracaceae bacterium]